MKTQPDLYKVHLINSIQDMILQPAKLYESKLALEDLKDTPIKKVTYKSLLKEVPKFGKELGDIKLPKRNHMALIGENRVQWGITYLPAMCFDHVVVPIDARLNIDNDGFLHIFRRKKNVYPEEIEDWLNRIPFIQESLLYGEEDPKLDEVISAQILVDSEAFIELSETRGIPITPELINEVITKEIKKFTIREEEFEKTTTQKIKRYLVTKQ